MLVYNEDSSFLGKSDCWIPWPQPPHSLPHTDRLALRELHEYGSHPLDSARRSIPKILLSNLFVLCFHGWVTPLLTYLFLLCCQYVYTARSNLVGQQPLWLLRETWQIPALIHSMWLSWVCNPFPLFPRQRSNLTCPVACGEFPLCLSDQGMGTQGEEARQ